MEQQIKPVIYRDIETVIEIPENTDLAKLVQLLDKILVPYTLSMKNGHIYLYITDKNFLEFETRNHNLIDSRNLT